MSKERMQHCAYCGDQLGVYWKPAGDLDSCGKAECNREIAHSYKAQEDQARHQAEEDGYSRYGGPGRW